jgi:hypothetical protein
MALQAPNKGLKPCPEVVLFHDLLKKELDTEDTDQSRNRVASGVKAAEVEGLTLEGGISLFGDGLKGECKDAGDVGAPAEASRANRERNALLEFVACLEWASHLPWIFTQLTVLPAC